MLSAITALIVMAFSEAIFGKNPGPLYIFLLIFGVASVIAEIAY